MNCEILIDCCETKDWNRLEVNAHKVSEAINKRKYEIGQVIADLRSLLTDTNEEHRSNGMKIVSLILNSLDTDILTDNEVLCILEFFNNRLKDRIPVIENSLSGLKSLCQFSQFNFEMATSLFFTIQNEVSIQLLKPEYKVLLYKIVKNLFSRFKLDFISLGSNFIYGFLRIVDAETSPTCLVEVFELFHDIASIKKFDIFKEDLFEAMACYFPIIYNKQKNDKYYETKLHLSKLLDRAMSSTSSFAEYVIQLALEKLDSESIGSKQSCYQLLQCAFPSYTLNQVEPFIHELWTFIRIDTLRPTNESDELATYALLTLTKLSDILSINSTVCTSFLEKVWKDLEISLKSPELNLINSTVKIFIALSSSNLDVYGFFFERSHPILLQNFLFTNQSKHQSLCLNALYEMLLYGRKISFLFNSEIVMRFFNLLIDYSAKDIESELRLNSLLFLNELVCVHKLEETHIIKLINYLCTYADQSNYSETLLNPAFELIKNVSIHNSRDLLTVFIEPLRKEIESSSSFEAPQLQNRLLFQLTVMRSAALEIYIFNHVAAFLVDRLIYFLGDLDNNFYENCSLNILKTLWICFEAHQFNNEFADFFYQTCMDPLLNHFTRLCFQQKVEISFEIIQNFSLLFSKFLSKISGAKQKIFAQIVKLAVERNISDFLIDGELDSSWTILNMNNLSATQVHFFLSLIYSYYFNCNSASNVQTLVDIFGHIKSYCFEYSLSPDSFESSIELSSAILSQIILRFDSENQQYVTILSEEIFCGMKSRIESDSVSMEHKTASLSILMWTSKCLFIKNHHLFKNYVQFFLQLLDQNIMTFQVLKLVDILYSNEDFLQNSPIAKMLSPSEKFSVDLQKLISQRYNQNKKPEFLFLFMSHLRFIPDGIFASQISQLFLDILSGLEVSHFSQINLISLSFIENIIKNNYNLVLPHIVSVFRSVIELARNSSELQIRKMALDCICLIIDRTSDQDQDLLNLKVEFLRNLQPTLADHKRMVRASAVKAFCKLSMLGQPGNRSKL